MVAIGSALALVAAALVAGGVLPGGGGGLLALLFLTLAVVFACYAVSRWRATRRVGAINVALDFDMTKERDAGALEVVSIIEEQLLLSGLPPPSTGGAPPLPAVGPLLAATDTGEAKTLAGVLDLVANLSTAPSGHDLAIAILPAGPDGWSRLRIRLRDRVSGALDLSTVVRGEDLRAAAREAAFQVYVHAARHACGKAAGGRSSAWSSASSLKEWMDLRETTDLAGLGRLARREPGNAAVRIRLAQLHLRAGDWAEALERLVDILATEDEAIWPDVELRMAMALMREDDADALATAWLNLPDPPREVLWRGLHAALRRKAPHMPADGLGPALLEVAIALCDDAAERARAARRRDPAQRRAIVLSAELIRADAIGQRTASETERVSAARKAEAHLPRDGVGWQAHYNAACLLCRVAARIGSPPEDLLSRAHERLLRVVTDPEWLRGCPNLANERRRWLFRDDPGLSALRDDDGAAGRDFRRLREQLLPDESGASAEADGPAVLVAWLVQEGRG